MRKFDTPTYYGQSDQYQLDIDNDSDDEIKRVYDNNDDYIDNKLQV